jgi:hypothetical protein
MGAAVDRMCAGKFNGLLEGVKENKESKGKRK